MSNVALLKNLEPIFALENEILKHPQVEMPITNEFCDGVYARTMHIPANTVLTGAIHKHECFFVVRSGIIVITTDSDPVILQGGDMRVTPPMTKRAGVAITDCIITTFHKNEFELREEEDLFKFFSVDPKALEVLQ